MPDAPRRAFGQVEPLCPAVNCGRRLYVHPFHPGDPPKTVTCECGWSGLASWDVEWYIEQVLLDTLIKRRAPTRG